MLLLAQIHPLITGILIAVFLVVCILMILVVLIQRPAGGGLSGAFGSGAGSGQTAFGAKTGDALTIATVGVFFIYLVFAVGLNFAARPQEMVVAPAQPEILDPAPIGPDMDERPPADWAPQALPPAPVEPGLPPAEPGAGAPAGEPAGEPGTGVPGAP